MEAVLKPGNRISPEALSTAFLATFSPYSTLGILVSTHPDMMAAFAANDVFQKTAASGGHIRTKIVTLKDQLDADQAVRPSHLTESTEG